MSRQFLLAKRQGFTLVEVLVALAIVGTGLMAIVSAVTNSAKVTNAAEQKMLASWVSANRFAELHLQTTPLSIGTKSGSVEMGGQRWSYKQDISKTEDPDLYEVRMEVYLESRPDVLQSSMFSYIGKPKSR